MIKFKLCLNVATDEIKLKFQLKKIKLNSTFKFDMYASLLIQIFNARINY